jgi:hypothetical protein
MHTCSRDGVHMFAVSSCGYMKTLKVREWQMDTVLTSVPRSRGKHISSHLLYNMALGMPLSAHFFYEALFCEASGIFTP